MHRIITLFTLSGVLFLTAACGNGDNDYGQQDDLDVEQEVEEAQQAESFDTPEGFRSDLESALSIYLELVDDLVEEQTDQATTHADEFEQAIAGMDASELDDAASMFWQEYSERIQTHAAALQEHGEVDDQRYEFEHLSEALIEVVKSMGPIDMELYQQRCPMVRDDEADWLSSHSEIRNPYHGDAMMDCGTTVEEL